MVSHFLNNDDDNSDLVAEDEVDDIFVMEPIEHEENSDSDTNALQSFSGTGNNSDSDDSDYTEDSEDYNSSNSDNQPVQATISTGGPVPSTSGCATDSVFEEEEEEDDLIKAIKRENERVREHPPLIQCANTIVDISFHPESNILAVAAITGDVFLYKYTNDCNTLVSTLELHTDSCRDIEFNQDGKLLLSASKDKSVMISDVQTEKLVRFYDDAHTVPLYCIRILDENLFATGDDSGSVKLWDLRRKENKPLFQMKRNEEYISDMLCDEGMNYMVVSSGDGSINAVDLKERKFFMQSEPYEEELTSLGLFRSESKVLASTSNGKLYLYNWREFGLHSDMYQGPDTCINRLIPITENIVVTAGDDGQLRATHLFPNRHLGIVGQHKLSIDCLDMSGDGGLLASGGDEQIRFWPVGFFQHLEKVCEKKQTKETKRKELDFQLPSSKRRNVSDFFSDM